MKSHFAVMIIILMGLISPPLFANSDEPADQSEPDYSSSIASQNQGAFQDQALLASNGDSYSRNAYYPEYKSESKATMLALFPGFFIHGMGHFYAEDLLTGSILLGVEIVSIPIFRAWIKNTLNDNRHDDSSDSGNALLLTGIVLFLGSWVYDFAHADAAVRNYNKKIRSQIYYRSGKNGHINLGLVFSF